jgi:hypothetical protein
VCQTLLRLCLCLAATPAHEPERPSEPWLKGVHPTQAEWKKTRSYRGTPFREEETVLRLSA